LPNVHTHGLAHVFRHRDLQLVVPLRPEVACDILANLADLIKGGSTLADGRRYQDVIRDADVLLVAATEGGRPVLRVILPDRHGCLDRGRIDRPLNRQWPGHETDPA
jgi:hypothetical protein